MRWTTHDPQAGEARVRNGFLWLPKFIAGEWRWLERAAWIETYRETMSLCPESGPGLVWAWVPDGWVDDQ